MAFRRVRELSQDPSRRSSSRRSSAGEPSSSREGSDAADSEEEDEEVKYAAEMALREIIGAAGDAGTSMRESGRSPTSHERVLSLLLSGTGPGSASRPLPPAGTPPPRPRRRLSCGAGPSGEVRPATPASDAGSEREEKEDAVEVVRGAFASPIGVLFGCESWELRELAVDRLESALLRRSSEAEWSGDEDGGGEVEEDGSPPRFWARAVPVAEEKLPMPSPTFSGDSDEFAASSSESAHPDEQLIAACCMLADALADGERRVVDAALRLLQPDGAVLTTLLPRCSTRAVRRAAPRLLPPLAAIAGGTSCRAAASATAAALGLIARPECGVTPLLPLLTQGAAAADTRAIAGRLRICTALCESTDVRGRRVRPPPALIEQMLPRSTEGVRHAETDVRRAAVDFLAAAHSSGSAHNEQVEEWLARQPPVPEALLDELEVGSSHTSIRSPLASPPPSRGSSSTTTF